MGTSGAFGNGRPQGSPLRGTFLCSDKLLFIGRINGTLFDENVGKGLAPSGGVQYDA